MNGFSRVALLAASALVLVSIAAAQSGSNSGVKCLDSQYLDSVVGKCVNYKNQGEKAETDYGQAVDSGNTAWMLVSSALVMVMTPGVAFFYAGLAGEEMASNTIMMSFTPSGTYGTEIPHLLFAFFQTQFAMITPALLSGGIVGRMKYNSFLIFILLWTTLVYDPLAHWMWSLKLDESWAITAMGWEGKMGSLDFAGGTVIHISSGFGALAAALMGAADGIAATAAINTHLASCAGFLTWVGLEFGMYRKFDPCGAASGAVAGLVCITPACGYVYPWASVIFGVVGALTGFAAVQMKNHLRYDDTLDSFGIHGCGGFVGGLMTGLFATSDVNSNIKGGAFYGNGEQFVHQLVSQCVAAGCSFVVTMIILYLLKITIGLRVDENMEIFAGLRYLHPCLSPLLPAPMGWVDVFRRGRAAVPKHSWSVFGPKVKLRSVQPVEMLRVIRFPHLNLVQTHVQPSKFQTQLMRWGTVLAVTSATYQFLTNLHTVPITGRTQVVVLSREEECELGNKAAQEELAGAKLIEDGPQLQLCLDVATRLVSVSEHLFPREYEWCVWLVDNPSSANACCAPGGKIIVQTGILDLIDFAVQKGICRNKHDALAVVMAHEIGHALARHTAESMSMLPLMYLQLILGMESPLLEYIFQFALNLPFSRSQEAEADHIGIMLLASACYDPSEAPRLWKAFTAFYADPEAGEGALDMDFDWVSTHPSNRKRERALDALVEAALELQRRSSWCAFLQQKVLELVGANTEAELLHHIRAAMTQARAEEAHAPRPRNTIGAIHELESQEMLKVIRGEAAQHEQQAATAATA
ncbi:hypothetical protein PF004_g9775 [Phytophthora fragariae]|uniref:Ammonium transporter AmtB-like domain-containing protein n=1 Tax=Phytophthora fragariae TaxID=53985 RepID=A0A6G0P371_9STRA|nr:hypothetical protein PF004_g9775 [Phytophthora fragariae]